LRGAEEGAALLGDAAAKLSGNATALDDTGLAGFAGWNLHPDWLAKLLS